MEETIKLSGGFAEILKCWSLNFRVSSGEWRTFVISEGNEYNLWDKLLYIKGFNMKMAR